ncbi:MAG: TIGR00295 family protein [Candidatus Bathyarchaeota archaeon]|nr:MAG: TIGR00295 family protein [Candidatus Bathyarchaeota archaeon]
MLAREDALGALREAGCSGGVMEHCVDVARIASKIAHCFREKGVEVDLALVEAGALLHDLGRARTHSIRHGVVGGEMARELGLPEPVVRIIERHIGAGIPCEEAAELGLPDGRYVPETVEERIVAYADKLVEGGREVEFSVTLEWYIRKHGEGSPVVERLRALHEGMAEVIGG